MCVGDRLLAINDWPTTEGSLADTYGRLQQQQQASGGISSVTTTTTLLVEFDVADPMVPASGHLCVVKLAKRGNSLGAFGRLKMNYNFVKFQLFF